MNGYKIKTDLEGILGMPECLPGGKILHWIVKEDDLEAITNYILDLLSEIG